MRDMVKMAEEVRKRIKPPAADCTNSRRSYEAIDLKLCQLDESLHAAQREFSAEAIRDQNEETAHERRYRRACGEAWGETGWEKPEGRGAAVLDTAITIECVAAANQADKPGHYERRIRDAVSQWAADLDSELTRRATQFARVIPAFQKMAATRKGATETVVELDKVVAEQCEASRYEIYEVVEDAARKSAMRMETVGLAFSGGGIRSATFNLGFLQGAAALGLLKQFDYLSTVSGGGYIGAWFAAWVLREGGWEPKRHTEDGEAHKPRDPVGDPRMTEAARKDKKAMATQIDQKRQKADVDARMERTAQALENVQKQLSSSRVRQAGAVRRWAWPAGKPQATPKAHPRARARAGSSPPRTQQLPRPQDRSVVDRHLDDGFGISSQPVPKPVHRATDDAGHDCVAAVGAASCSRSDIGPDDRPRPRVAGAAPRLAGPCGALARARDSVVRAEARRLFRAVDRQAAPRVEKGIDDPRRRGARHDVDFDPVHDPGPALAGAPDHGCVALVWSLFTFLLLVCLAAVIGRKGVCQACRAGRADGLTTGPGGGESSSCWYLEPFRCRPWFPRGLSISSSLRWGR